MQRILGASAHRAVPPWTTDLGSLKEAERKVAFKELQSLNKAEFQALSSFSVHTDFKHKEWQSQYLLDAC